MRRSYGPYQRGLRSRAMYDDIPYVGPKPAVTRRERLLRWLPTVIIASFVIVAAVTRFEAPPESVLPPISGEEFAQFIEQGEALRNAAGAGSAGLDEGAPTAAGSGPTMAEGEAATPAGVSPDAPAAPALVVIAAPGQPSVAFIDAHLHAIPGVTPAETVRAMDSAGVRQAVLMPLGADEDARKAADAFPGRFIPFAGGASLARLTNSSGPGAWNLTAASAKSYLAALDQAIRRGDYRGIGELVIVPESHADSPLVQALMKLSGDHQTPLVLTMSGTATGMARLKRALDANPAARVVWAGCGGATAEQARRMLAAHANLFCDLSGRDAERYGRSAPITDIRGTLTAAWKTLLEEQAERFMVGTDARNPFELRGRYGLWAGFHQKWLGQLSAEAAEWIGERTLERAIGE